MKVRNRLLLATALAGLTLPSHQAAAGTLTFIHRFTGAADGAGPSGIAVSADGTLYGETYYGGQQCVPSPARQFGCGTLFRLDPSDDTLTTLLTFNGVGRGRNGSGPITLFGDTRYGSTAAGGAHDDGVIFARDQTTAFKVLHSFDGADGETPEGPVVIDAAGNLFGTTNSGGSVGGGVLYEVKPDGTYLLLHDFAGGPEGVEPNGLVADSGGTLYGATAFGETVCYSHGQGKNNNCGTVFSYEPATGIFTVIHRFSGRHDGSIPLLGGVDNTGSLFGVTYRGGASESGTVFELHKVAPGYRLKILHTFTGQADGGLPGSPFVDAHGNLTGTTTSGGTAPSGAVGVLYSLPRNGTFTLLHTFAIRADLGYSPGGAPMPDRHGAFYGVTSSNGTRPCILSSSEDYGDGCGTIWKYTP